MEKEECPRVRIYSYRKVWKVEKKIYSFMNVKLPGPINPHEFMEGLGIALFMLLLSRLFPFAAAVPSVLKYLVLPYVTVRYLMKLRLDGKNPFRYWAGYCQYLGARHCYLEHFRSCRESKRAVKLRWQCSRGI